MRRTLPVAAPLMLTTALICCAPGTPLGAHAAGRAPDSADLANAAYRLTSVPGVVRLHNGTYRVPAAPGAASETVVTLTPQVATGELGGRPVAAAVLVTSTGGLRQLL
jgi:hypothetical protein